MLKGKRVAVGELFIFFFQKRVVIVGKTEGENTQWLCYCIII